MEEGFLPHPQNAANSDRGSRRCCRHLYRDVPVTACETLRNVVDAAKSRSHRDIVADPILHARVLNLYLCGEAYPHAVDDYFPVEHVDSPDLAQRMRSHLKEEDKHAALYAKAIQT